MAKEELMWLRVNDFSPGIVTNLRGAKGKHVPTFNPGAATAENTYRCIALPNGGLGPLPKRTYEYSRGSTPDNPSNLQDGRQFIVNGFYVAGPLNTGTGSFRGHEFFFSIEYLYNNGGTPERRYRLERFPLFSGGASLEPNLISWNSTTSFPSLNQYVTTKFLTTSSNSPVPELPGVPVVVFAHNAPGPLNPARIGTFPDQDSLDQSTIGEMYYDEYRPALMVAHQGRVVFFDQRNYPHGALSAGQWLNNEFAFFTQRNDLLNMESFNASQYSPENPAGYGTAASLSANELLLIKKRHGGVMVQGSLASPLVTNLPSIASADRNEGAPTRKGFIYAGDDGQAHLWAGGQTTHMVSEQLNDWFFLPDDDPNIFLDTRTIWANWGSQYMVTSNLYLLDLESMGWWRLDDPDDLRQGIWNMQMGNARFLYGSTYSFTSGNDTLVYGWDKREMSTDWSWQGHPIRPFEGRREFEIRQVLICGQGVGTITVTPINLDGTTGNPIQVDFNNNDVPEVIRMNVAHHQQFLHYRVQSSGSAEAPELHWIEWGIDPRGNIPIQTASLPPVA